MRNKIFEEIEEVKDKLENKFEDVVDYLVNLRLKYLCLVDEQNTERFSKKLAEELDMISVWENNKVSFEAIVFKLFVFYKIPLRQSKLLQFIKERNSVSTERIPNMKKTLNRMRVFSEDKNLSTEDKIQSLFRYMADQENRIKRLERRNRELDVALRYTHRKIRLANRRINKAFDVASGKIAPKQKPTNGLPKKTEKDPIGQHLDNLLDEATARLVH